MTGALAGSALYGWAGPGVMLPRCPGPVAKVPVLTGTELTRILVISRLIILGKEYRYRHQWFLSWADIAVEKEGDRVTPT